MKQKELAKKAGVTTRQYRNRVKNWVPVYFNGKRALANPNQIMIIDDIELKDKKMTNKFDFNKTESLKNPSISEAIDLYVTHLSNSVVEYDGVRYSVEDVDIKSNTCSLYVCDGNFFDDAIHSGIDIDLVYIV